MAIIELDTNIPKDNQKVVEGPFGTHDTFRYGFRSVAHEVQPKHELQLSLETFQETKEKNRYISAGRLFGSHLPLRMQMEKALTGLVGGRHGTLPSSNLGLSVLMGDDEDIDFEDFLNG